MDTSNVHQKLRKLPAIHKVLSAASFLQQQYSFELISEVASQTVDEVREKIVREELDDVPVISELVQLIQMRLHEIYELHYRPVINATGVILHTNLGRAPLAKAALQAIMHTAGGYSNLEFRLEEGKRGSRYEHVEQLLCKLTGAEAALVVNNNAAAVLLILRELARDREVIISRGQIVEIGGSFRVSEVMRESGCKLVEVGTTNKTHVYDYERAVTDQTALILRVHTSNFRIVGFTQQPALEELVALAHEHQLPLYEDLGSGCLLDLTQFGVAGEPTVSDSLRAGVDVVSFSGDKLLGGAQAGIIVGKATYIERLKKNQLTRALRLDKLTLAALEATLQLYIEPKRAIDQIPTLWMMNRKPAELLETAQHLRERLYSIFHNNGIDVQVVTMNSQIGGGSLPGEDLPSFGLQFSSDQISMVAFESELRKLQLPVIARFSKESLLFDVRTILYDQLDDFVKGCEIVHGKLSSRNQR